jgi:hypothetical protein
MEKINLDWYQNQIALLDKAIESARQQKQLVTSLYVTKMESEGWVYINTERWDYDASSGLSPRLISAELAAKMGIYKFAPLQESEEISNFRKLAKTAKDSGEKPPTPSQSIYAELAAKSDHEMSWKRNAEDNYYAWYRESPEMRGLYTKVLETEAWLKSNEIRLDSLVENSYEP